MTNSTNPADQLGPNFHPNFATLRAEPKDRLVDALLVIAELYDGREVGADTHSGVIDALTEIGCSLAEHDEAAPSEEHDPETCFDSLCACKFKRCRQCDAEFDASDRPAPIDDDAEYAARFCSDSCCAAYVGVA